MAGASRRGIVFLFCEMCHERNWIFNLSPLLTMDFYTGTIIFSYFLGIVFLILVWKTARMIPSFRGFEFAAVGLVLYYLNQFFRRSQAALLNFTARSKAGNFGEGSQFLGGSGRVYGWENINIGKNVKIMDGCFFNCSHGELFIGDNTIISRNCTIYTWNHEYEGDKLPFDEQVRINDVVIGANVWIGMNVTVLPGSFVNEGVIIGAGSVVKGEIGKLAIAGAPVAREVGKRDEKHYYRKKISQVPNGEAQLGDLRNHSAKKAD